MFSHHTEQSFLSPWSIHIHTYIYRVRQNKTPIHENRNFSEMREYFYIKFCSFVQHITAHKSIVTGRICRRAALPVLFYSRADFWVFRPAGATYCTDQGEI